MNTNEFKIYCKLLNEKNNFDYKYIKFKDKKNEILSNLLFTIFIIICSIVLFFLDHIDSLELAAWEKDFALFFSFAFGLISIPFVTDLFDNKNFLFTVFEDYFTTNTGAYYEERDTNYLLALEEDIIRIKKNLTSEEVLSKIYKDIETFEAFEKEQFYKLFKELPEEKYTIEEKAAIKFKNELYNIENN